MCGRYYFSPGEAARLGYRAGEVFPGQTAPVIAFGEGKEEIRLMKWGFPRIGGGGLVINSRSEKADVTPMFRKAARERRCLVPMSGFFEWRRTAAGVKTKEKYAFETMKVHREGGLMMAAGLYGSFAPKESEPFHGYVILTREADEQMRPYHHRMPVLLEGEACSRWLGMPPDTPWEVLRQMFLPPQLCIRKTSGMEADR